MQLKNRVVKKMNKFFNLDIMRRELFYMWRDKGLRNILLLVPLIGVILFGATYSVQVIKDIPTAIVDLDHSSSSRELIEGLREAENLKVTAYLSTYEEMEELIRRDKLVVGVVIPKNFAKDIASHRGTRVLAVIDGSNVIYATNASTAIMTVTRTISAEAGIKTLVGKGMTLSEAKAAYQSIEFKEEPWFNPTLNYAYFLILGLALNMWQQCCTLASCMNIIGETGTNSWVQLKAAGVSKLKLFFNKSLVHIFTFMVIVLPVYFIAFVILKLPLACGFPKFFLFTLAFVVALHSLGTFMSSFARNAVDASRFGMIVALPSFVLSGFTWPIEAMPLWSQPLVKILPQTWFFQGINYMCFKNPDWTYISTYFAVFMLIAVICYSLAAFITGWTER